jgi:hypothetical protein
MRSVAADGVIAMHASALHGSIFTGAPAERVVPGATSLREAKVAGMRICPAGSTATSNSDGGTQHEATRDPNGSSSPFLQSPPPHPRIILDSAFDIHACLQDFLALEDSDG